MSMTPVPTSMRCVRAAMALSSGTGAAPGAVVTEAEESECLHAPVNLVDVSTIPSEAPRIEQFDAGVDEVLHIARGARGVVAQADRGDLRIRRRDGELALSRATRTSAYFSAARLLKDRTARLPR